MTHNEEKFSNIAYKMTVLELAITIQKWDQKLTPLDSSDGCQILSNI